MAFVAIMVKGVMLALVGHFILFGRYLVDIKSHKDIKIKYMLIACLVTFITSMLVETYVMNINLVYCPFSYCVLSSLCYLGKEQKEECIVTSDNG